MKLLQSTSDSFTFLVGPGERELLVKILQRYPVIIPAHYKSRGSKDESLTATEELLQDALTDIQKENRRRLDNFLAETSRFAPRENGFEFRLKHREFEWLLQVLNDIRVGSWIELGEPELDSDHALETLAETPQNFQRAWTMEMAGGLQAILLRSVQSPPAGS